MWMRWPIRSAGIAGALLCGSAFAKPPINLLAPMQASPQAGTAIQAVKLPPPTVASPPRAGSAGGISRYADAIPDLLSARAALSRHRYGTAGAALEKAETRLLNDGVGAGRTTGPAAAAQALLQVGLARQAVSEHDQSGALGATGRALAALKTVRRSPSSTAMAHAARPARPPAHARSAAAPPVPMITKALLPGRWRLKGWKYRWVPPDKNYRPVETRPLSTGHYVWRDRAWVWDPGYHGQY